jgi:diaminopimelate epimerase
MTIPFNKYQGTGNDFIIIDNREALFNPDATQAIKTLCERRLGIGADGLILISDREGFDFEMKYFNSDGNESSMCGNGGRCAADFALRHSIAGEKQRFLTFDGVHRAFISENLVKLGMNDVENIKIIDGNYFINTGSPHYIIPVSNVKEIDVFTKGRKLRYSEIFAPEGTNVNFVELLDNGIFVRTYERGVEDETFSCGTGVTASAISAVLSGHFVNGDINVMTKGGKLRVEFSFDKERITDIWLTGPATYVFEGVITV